MLKTESKAIGLYTYEFTQLPTTEALALLPVAMRVLGPVLVEALGQLGKFANLKETDEVPAEVLSALLSQLFHVDGADIQKLSATLASKTRVVGAEGAVNLGKVGDNAGVYETHWPERWGDWAQWLWFALVVQYRSFLGGLPSGLLGQLGQAKAP